MKIISSEQMREIDNLTINSGLVSGRELMRRAGMGIADESVSYVKSHHKVYFKRFVVIAGKGNNGGDAYVVANHLYEKHQCNVVVFSTEPPDKLSEDARFYAIKLNPSIRHEIRQDLKDSDFAYGDVVIDGLLGTGFEGELKEPYRSWIEVVNRQNNPVIAIDIPSGLNATTGKGTGIIADLTITVGLPKIGFFINEGVKATGKVIPIDIGFPVEYIERAKSNLVFYSENSAVDFLKRIPCDIHKNSRGRVLIIGGSKYYTGAPVISGMAALKSGAGLVTVAVPQSSGISSNCHSLIIRKVNDDNKGVFTDSSLDEIKKLIEKHDSIAIGMGMSQEESSLSILKAAFDSGKRVVFDADALNLLARNISILKSSNNCVFTPHTGEGARLGNAFAMAEGENRITFAQKLNEKLGGVLILKGNKSIIQSRDYSKTYINSSGSASLATAGSGDALSGILGALLSKTDNSTLEASLFGTYIHGKAGELAEIDLGIRGVCSEDIINYIPKAMKLISPFA